MRISKKSGAIIAKPSREEYKKSERIKDKQDGMKDTPAESVLFNFLLYFQITGLINSKVLEVTYKGENFDLIKKEFEMFIQEKEKKDKLLVFDE